MTDPLRALLLLTTLAAPLAAQTPEPATRTAHTLVGEALGRAKETGALARLTETRSFRLGEETPPRGLITLGGSLVGPAGQPEAVRFSVSMLLRGGGDRVMEAVTELELGMDGAPRSLANATRLHQPGGEALDAVKVEGRREGEEFLMRVQEAGKAPREERRPWSGDLYPGVIVFALAPLADQGLPEKLPFTGLDGRAAQAKKGELRVRAEPPLRVVACAEGLERGQDVETMVLHVDEAGKIVSMKFLDQGATPVTNAEAEELRAKLLPAAPR